jgi:hypothetical protein
LAVNAKHARGQMLSGFRLGPGPEDADFARAVAIVTGEDDRSVTGPAGALLHWFAVHDAQRRAVVPCLLYRRFVVAPSASIRIYRIGAPLP